MRDTISQFISQQQSEIKEEFNGEELACPEVAMSVSGFIF